MDSMNYLLNQTDVHVDKSRFEFILDEDGSILRINQSTDSFFHLTEGQLSGQNILDYLNNEQEREKLLNVFGKLAVNPQNKFTIKLNFSYKNLQLLTSCDFSKSGISNGNYFSLKLLPLKIFSEKETDHASSKQNEVFPQKIYPPDGVQTLIVSSLTSEIKKGAIVSSNEFSRDNKLKTTEVSEINHNFRDEITWSKQVTEISEVGFWDVKFLSDEVYSNKNLCELFGIDSEKCKNCDFTRYQSMIVEADKHKFKEAIKKHIAGETPKFNVEHRIKTCNNELKWVLSKGEVVLRDDDGNPIRFMGRIEDITVRKLAEEEIIKSNRKAKELTDTKSQFVSMISHEFRTPLSTILSSTDLLHSFSDEMNSEEKEKLYDRIGKSVDTLTELLNDILTLNKTDSEKHEVKLEAIEIISLCKLFIEEVNISNKETPLILFASNVQQHTMQSDEKLLRQIILNLLTNAIKYNRKQNEIKMRVEIGTEVLISIEDHGIGITQEDQPNLFSPFFRGSNIKGISGTGLGLAIVKSSVELLNGEIWFEGEEKIGSTFHVKLPIKEAS